LGKKGTGALESKIDKRGLIDTDILIDALRGEETAERFLFQQQMQGGIQISVISAMELIRGSRNSAVLRIIQKFLKKLHILMLDQSISNKAHELIVQFSLSHRLDIADALIAATALVHDLWLFSKNIRHFLMIPGLLVDRPY
jgi:predicted nucleic acid-binding protein